MTPDPLTDAIAFLTQPIWPIGVLWLLILASIAFAVRALRRQLPPPGFGDLGIWALRVLVGCMWWQQSMWKIPRDYNGLLHWLGEMVDHSAIPALGGAVHDSVIPRIALFGPLVYGVEVAVAVSLILGLLSRLGSLLGLGLATVLWLGLYSAPGEWPWTYAFLMVIQLLWVIRPPGYSVGVDALIAVRRGRGVVA